MSVDLGRADKRRRVFRKRNTWTRTCSGLAGKRSVCGRFEGTHQVDGGHGPVELGVAVTEGRRRGAPRVLVLVQQPGDVIRAVLDDVAWEAEKARGGQRRKRGARGDARGDSRSTRARGNASEAPRSGRPRACSSDDGRGSIPAGVGRHARVEKSCGGLKAAPARKSRVRDDAATAYLHVGDAES